MYKKSIQEKSKDAIRTICNTAIMVDTVLDDNGTNLMIALEQAAEAIQKNYGLDERIMGEYKDKVKASKNLKIGELEKVKTQDLENAQNIIYLVCDKLENPKEIMRYVRTANEMIYLWTSR